MDILHDHERWLSTLAGDDFMDCHDVGMGQEFGDLGLAKEGLPVTGRALGLIARDQGLDGDDAARVRVTGQIDRPHGAIGQGLDDLVASIPLLRRVFHGRFQG